MSNASSSTTTMSNRIAAAAGRRAEAELQDIGAKGAPRFVGLRRTRIDGLVLSCRVGIHAHEQTAPQRVRIDVELVTREEPATLLDRIESVICYEQLTDRIKEMVQAGHANLVETLATRIADHCCSIGMVERVRVGVRKLDAIREAESVGVELERVAVGSPR
jgi:dihydroneopterin aldolase